MSTRLALLLIGTACLFALAGCGGGGGGAGADEPLSYATGPLRAQIQFPPDRSLGLCGQITVRGTAGGAGISAVRVNGVAATGFGEFGEWVARIPLVCGSNVIRVAVEDSDGLTLSSADSVRLEILETILYAPRAVSVTSEPVAVYAVDFADDALVVVNIDDGTRRRIQLTSAQARGAVMAKDGGSRVFLQAGYTLTEVNLSSGQISTIPMDNVGARSLRHGSVVGAPLPVRW